MKIKLRDTITDYEGKPVTVPNEETGTKTPLTYFDVFINSLNSQAPGEMPLTAEKKSQIYQISKKMYQSNEPNFTTNELSLIKERIGKTYAPMVYGKICDLFDGVEDGPKQEAATVAPDAPQPPAPETPPAN